MSKNNEYYELNEQHTDPKRVKKERDKAQKLKKSQWWLNHLNRGICHYCQKKVARNLLTMDHIVPIARGGTSTPGNIVPACKECNQNKKLHTPVDQLLQQIQEEKSEGNEE